MRDLISLEFSVSLLINALAFGLIMRFFILIFFSFIFTNPLQASEKGKAYFAGGCFWCVEESFEKLNGVEEVISGYSGGKKNVLEYRKPS